MKKVDRILLESVNPFTNELTIQVSELTNKHKYVNVNSVSDGIITEAPNILNITYLVDKSDKCQIFTKSGLRLHINSLSKNAKSVFIWIIYELEDSQDWLWINKTRYKSECGGNFTDLKKGIEELTISGIITPTVVLDAYWINPLFFFNGSRVKKYPSNLKMN